MLLLLLMLLSLGSILLFIEVYVLLNVWSQHGFQEVFVVVIVFVVVTVHIVVVVVHVVVVMVVVIKVCSSLHPGKCTFGCLVPA
jgi:hypothetical protein